MKAAADAAQHRDRRVERELRRIGHRPRKRFGQHFLADSEVARRIVDLAAVRTPERVIEIGPGLGALTDVLVERTAELWLIEIDVDLAKRLETKYAGLPHVHVLAADVLRVDFASLLGFDDSRSEPAVVVANLPYNIATAVLAALLDQRGCFSRMVLMLQREVVERLCAEPGSKDYAALSVLTQFAAGLRIGLRVGPEAFVPPPQVESEVVLVEPYARWPIAVTEPALLIRIVRAAFNQRRKQLVNSLRSLCTDPAAALYAARIDPTRRPETLTLREFALLSDTLSEMSGLARRLASSTPSASGGQTGPPSPLSPPCP